MSAATAQQETSLAPVSVRSDRSTTARDGQKYHGLGNMSLNYKVSDVSSTDPAYSVDSLNTDHTFGSNFGRGWLSRKFCEFPQTLTLTFERPVRVKTLQFLCHEVMIASRVELYYMPTYAVSPGELTRIGHFEFLNNLNTEAEQTKGLQPVRELKTVHFGASTRQLTIHLYSPFFHKDNIFQQVGLISVRAIGEILSSPPPAPPKPPQEQGLLHSDNRQGSAPGMPSLMQELLHKIRESQQQAAHQDNGQGEKSAKLKMAEDVLVQQGIRIAQLEQLKVQATQKEDYTTAKRINMLINQIMQQVSGIDAYSGTLPEALDPSVLAQKTQQRALEKRSPEEVYQSVRKETEGTPSAQHLMNSLMRRQEERRYFSDIKQYQMEQEYFLKRQKLAEEQKSRQDQSQQLRAAKTEPEPIAPLRNYTDQSFTEQDQVTEHAEEAKTFAQSEHLAAGGGDSKHNEDAVVPAQRRGVNMTFEEQMALYDTQVRQGLDPTPNMNVMEEIKHEKTQVEVKYEGPLAQLFKAELIKMLTSPRWHERLQGLKDVASDLATYQNEAAFSSAINHLLHRSIDERNAQINAQTVALISTVLSSLPSFVFEQEDDIISFVCDKAVEGKTQAAAVACFEQLTRHRTIDLHVTVGVLATQRSFFSKGSLSQPTQILARVRLLERATLDFQQICSERQDPVAPSYPLFEVQEMLKQTLEHPDSEVRSVSQSILQFKYEKEGFSFVEEVTRDLHPQILQAIKFNIPEVEQAIGSQRDLGRAAYGSSNANQWLIDLQKRLEYAQPGQHFRGRQEVQLRDNANMQSPQRQESALSVYDQGAAAGRAHNNYSVSDDYVAIEQQQDGSDAMLDEPEAHQQQTMASKHAEESVVPAQRRGVKMTFEEQMALYDNQIKLGLDPSPNMNLMQEINDAQIAVGQNDYSGPLNHLFEVEVVRLLTGPKWQDRFQGLKGVTQDLASYTGQERFSDVTNYLLNQFLDEKNTQINLQTVLLINAILTSLPDFVFDNIDDIISFVCDKGVETKIQLASTTCYELINRHKTADLHETVGILATQRSFFNKATLNSPKQIIFRLTLLNRATADFENICSERPSDHTLPQYPLSEVQDMLKQSLQNPDREIRATAQLIMQQLYEKNGFSAVEGIALKLHPQILQTIKPKIAEVDKVIQVIQKGNKVSQSSVYGSSGANGWPINLKIRLTKILASQGGLARAGSTKNLGQPKRKLPGKGGAGATAALTTDPSSNGDLANLMGQSEAGSSGKGGAADLKSDAGGAQLDETCQFCGITSPDFVNADKMDLHYVLQCQMLTNCVGCTQIIEVSSYTEHKLSQCAKKVDFKPCPRCKMAIEADFYEQHVTQLKCSPKETETIRCPLCQKDLAATGESEEKAWSQHLAIEKCPGANVRISTNAKARVSILRAKQPPAEEVIMEEEDEEDYIDTVGGKTPKLAADGRTTEMSKKNDSQFELEQDGAEVEAHDAPKTSQFELEQDAEEAESRSGAGGVNKSIDEGGARDSVQSHLEEQ